MTEQLVESLKLQSDALALTLNDTSADNAVLREQVAAQQLALQSAESIFSELDGCSWPQSERDAYHGEPGQCPVNYDGAHADVSNALALTRATIASELAELREDRAESAHLRERLVCASDLNVSSHVRLSEAGIPDHMGEDETYRSFGISERIDQLAKFKARLEWLHAGNSKDLDGCEWGVYRVKWDQHGQPAEVWQTNTDFSDLDAEMAREAAARSGGAS